MTLTPAQAQAEVADLKAKLDNKFLGSSHQRKIWRERRATLTKGLQLLNLTNHAKNNSNSAQHTRHTL